MKTLYNRAFSSVSPLKEPVPTHTIPSANPGETFNFTLTDVNGENSFGQDVTAPDTHPAGEPIIVGLNFAGQFPGHYQLNLNGVVEAEFVLLDPLANPNRMALVEIVIDPTATDPFALWQTSGSETQ